MGARRTKNTNKDHATIALLRSWREEDATDDPELIRQAELELEEFKRNMNENRRRAGAPAVYPELAAKALCSMNTATEDFWGTLEPPDIDYALIELLRKSCEKDSADNPEFICQTEIEAEEFKRNMNENRRFAGAPPEIDYALLELLQEWREEDATDDPELIRQREIEWEEFKRNMNENRWRAGAPPVYPDVPAYSEIEAHPRLFRS